MFKWILVFLSLSFPALAQVPPPSVTNALVSASGVTPYDCSGVITVGGTPQYLIPTTNPTNNPVLATNKVRGWMIMNVDTTAEGLCINFTPTGLGAATCTTSGFYFMQPATSTVAGGSYSSQLGFGTNKNPTIVAATTNHRFSCTYW